MKNDYISEIHKKDRLVLHPYEDTNTRGTYNRKLITKSDNIYLYDENYWHDRLISRNIIFT